MPYLLPSFIKCGISSGNASTPPAHCLCMESRFIIYTLLIEGYCYLPISPFILAILPCNAHKLINSFTSVGSALTFFLFKGAQFYKISSCK